LPKDTDLPLARRTIAVPETRELNTLARLLEERGAIAIRCPLVAIDDAPDPAPVEAWLRRFNEGCDDLILLTGEGLGRLTGFARRAGLETAFLARLATVRKITRGPKPARALRDLGLTPDLPATEPTSAGVMAALAGMDLRGRRIGVQLYPENAHERLLGFIASAGATADAVLPYVYASAADDGKVVALIKRIVGGEIDVVAFTSAAQVRRLVAVAEKHDLLGSLFQGLARARVAVIGPVVDAALRAYGVRVDIAPADSFFMKPLVTAISAVFRP
jgi:uroporphyrinogen-III synthase